MEIKCGLNVPFYIWIMSHLFVRGLNSELEDFILSLNQKSSKENQIDITGSKENNSIF